MANYFDKNFIHELLSRVDIVRIIENYFPLTHKGQQYWARCPFHQEKSASFTVHPIKQIYHCFGCHAGGNVITFLIEYDHLNFHEAVTNLAASVGIALPQTSEKSSWVKPNSNSIDYYEIMADFTSYFQQHLKTNPSAITYLKNRKLSGKIAKKYSIGYAPSRMIAAKGKNPWQKYPAPVLEELGLLLSKENKDSYPRFRDRIMFPIRDARGRVLGFGGRILESGEPKYLNSPETPLFHKGQVIYGLYEAMQTTRHFPRLVLVEGYMDVIALAEHGVCYAVAALGTATTARHIQQLLRYSEELIFCFDGDEAGKKAAIRALAVALPEMADNHRLRFIFLPQNEDPDSFVCRQGKAAFENLITQAIDVSDYLLAEWRAQGGNLNGVGAQARLIELARPLIQKMQAKTIQQLLVHELATWLRLPPERLSHLLQLPVAESGTAYLMRKPAPFAQVPLAQAALPLPKLVLAMLLNYPSLYHQGDYQALLELQATSHSIIRQTAEILESSKISTAAEILQVFSDTPSILNELVSLTTWETPLTFENLALEFDEAIHKLLEQEYDFQIQQLLSEAKQGILSEEGRVRLTKLIAARKQLK